MALLPQVLDGDEVLDLPVVGDFFRERMANIPQVRVGTGAARSAGRFRHMQHPYRLCCAMLGRGWAMYAGTSLLRAALPCMQQ